MLQVPFNLVKNNISKKNLLEQRIIFLEYMCKKKKTVLYLKNENIIKSSSLKVFNSLLSFKTLFILHKVDNILLTFIKLKKNTHNYILLKIGNIFSKSIKNFIFRHKTGFIYKKNTFIFLYICKSILNNPSFF